MARRWLPLTPSQLARLEGVAAGHRPDFEREREQCKVLKTTSELMAAREAAARLAGELALRQPCRNTFGAWTKRKTSRRVWSTALRSQQALQPL
jgi:hypothetical protein